MRGARAQAVAQLPRLPGRDRLSGEAAAVKLRVWTRGVRTLQPTTVFGLCVVEVAPEASFEAALRRWV